MLDKASLSQALDGMNQLRTMLRAIDKLDGVVQFVQESQQYVNGLEQQRDALKREIDGYAASVDTRKLEAQKKIEGVSSEEQAKFRQVEKEYELKRAKAKADFDAYLVELDSQRQASASKTKQLVDSAQLIADKDVIRINASIDVKNKEAADLHAKVALTKASSEATINEYLNKVQAMKTTFEREKARMEAEQQKAEISLEKVKAELAGFQEKMKRFLG